MVKIKIGEFLFEREGKYKPDDEAVSTLKRINKIDFSGNFHIAQKPSNTNMILIKSGDLVISGINVAKGAMGIYGGKKDITATIHYSSYTFDSSKINVEYFKRFLKSVEFIKLLQEKIKGGIKTEIKPKHILPLKIDLPDIKEQRKIVAHFQSIETEDTELKTEITQQQTLLKKLRQQILQEAIQGKLTQDWRVENSPPVEGWQTKSDGVVASRSDDGEVKKRNTQNYLSLPYNSKLKQKAKELRKAGNLSEVLFWQQVKNKQFRGLDFDRQKIIGNYIVDFYCPNHQVVIEIDGLSHDNKQEYDAQRDYYLNGLGLTVIHILDVEVKKNLDGVLRWLGLHEAFEPPHPSGTPPQEGNATTPSSLRDATPPQEGNWEPASELLKRIQAEKEQLIKDKKIKKQKPLPPISEDEKPFDFPDGWIFSPLANCSINKDEFRVPITKSDRDRREKIYDYYGASGVIDKIDHYTHQGRHLLVGEDGANLVARSTSIAFFAEGEFWVNNHAHVLATIDYITLDYLRIHINAIDLKPYLSGGFQPKLNQSNLNQIKIALPSLAEQKVIVAKVEKLLTICDKLETQITSNQSHAEQLMQAVLKEAFSQGNTQTEQVAVNA